ncbi:outer membrane beta-barrel protein [Luteitalea sp.]|uniref:outer membrane beta-barrel protein n=1 Tax=Luteitalea sp. TaxID=2004800 RepID=UPI0025BA8959|nr:outer membrane beta-barrel protein [Luteitalea sp.]
MKVERVPGPWRLARLVMGVAFALAGTQGRADAQEATRPAAPPPAAVKAQADPNPFRHINFGVTLEGYYQWNGNEPYDRVTPLRAYDTRANTFGLQQTAILIESAPDVAAGRRFGARVDLQFGQATAALQGSPANEPRPELYRNIWQAYGTYVFPVGRGLQTDFGKFASNLGYETNYAKDNHHFSRAYLFNFLPYYHTGVRVTLPVHDRVTLMYMLTNGIQQTEEFNDFKSSHVTAIVTPMTGVSWTVSYYAGREQPDNAEPGGPDGVFRVIDSYVNWAASPALALALDVNHTTNQVNQVDDARSTTGLGAYARYQVAPASALALRYEYLDDEGLFGGIDQQLQEVTATYEHRLADGFLVRGEYRRDWSHEAYFTGPVPGDQRRAQDTFTVGLVWWFGNKSGSW